MICARLLICGSRRFADRDFAFSFLDVLAARMNLEAIISGPFGGADAFSREWAIARGVDHLELRLNEEDTILHRFFDSRALPEDLLRSPEWLIKGTRAMRESDANAFVSLPSPNGALGPSTTNFARCAQEFGLPCVNGSHAFRVRLAQLSQERSNERQKTQNSLLATTAKSADSGRRVDSPNRETESS